MSQRQPETPIHHEVGIPRKKAIKASYPFRNNVFIAYVLSGFLVFYYTGITKGFPSTLEMVSSTS